MGIDLKSAPDCLKQKVLEALAREEARASVVPAQSPEAPAPEPIPKEIHLTVWGRARPSKRITGNMVHTEEAQGYLRWQEQVAEACMEIRPRPLPWEHFDLSTVFYFVKPPNEDAPGFGDYDNLRKSVTDGMARGRVFPEYRGKPNDARVRWDSGPSGVRYCKQKKRERVEITIREFKMPEPVD